MVKRFHDPGDWMQSPTGEYVAYEDYATLQAQLDAAHRLNGDLVARNMELTTCNREFALNEAKTVTGWFIQTLREKQARIRELESALGIILAVTPKLK